MKTPSSLRWQLQRYYFFILLFTLATLTWLATHWMREHELYKYDSRLRNLQAPLIPVMSGTMNADPRIFKKAPDVNDRRRSPRRRRGPGRNIQEDSAEPTRVTRRKKNQEVRDAALMKRLDQGWWFASWKPKGELVASSQNFPDFPKPNIELEPAEEGVIQDYQGYRLFISRSPRAVLVVAYPRNALDAEVNSRSLVIVGISTLLLVVSTTIGWLLIGRALKPLRAIHKTSKNIASGKFDSRIDSPTGTSYEISDLSQNLNQTFGQLETMFERQARFTSDASHELRTPISVILNHCQHGLSKERSCEEYRQALAACQRAGERMKNLTEDLLELSKLESGEINLVLSPCSLGQIAEEALELIDPLASGKGVILKDEIEDITINANGDRIWQVIVNLLNNAIRYTPPNKAITLRTEKCDQSVTISVIDEGEGIPANELPRLFDRFYRVDKSRSHPHQKGGFGLGLAICETIITAHGGSISASSTPGITTCFEVNLPA